MSIDSAVLLKRPSAACGGNHHPHGACSHLGALHTELRSVDGVFTGHVKHEREGFPDDPPSPLALLGNGSRRTRPTQRHSGRAQVLYCPWQSCAITTATTSGRVTTSLTVCDVMQSNFTAKKKTFIMLIGAFSANVAFKVKFVKCSLCLEI